MAGNNSIQILRGTSTYDPSASTEILLDGQLFYSHKTKKLYIGNGTDQLKNRKGTDIGLYLENGTKNGSLQGTSTQGALGNYSVALGYKTKVTSGTGAFVAGNWSEVDGNYSFAAGQQCKVVAQAAQALGNNSQATARAQLVCGEFNEIDANKLFIVGSGTADNARANVFTVALKSKGGGFTVYGNSTVTDGTLTVQNSPTEATHVIRNIDTNIRLTNDTTNVAPGSISQKSYIAVIDGVEKTVPGAISSGHGSVAFGGQRFDKIGESFDEEPITEAKGQQSFAFGGGVVVNGAWSVGLGKDTKTYQRTAFAAGGGTRAGMTEAEFNAWYWDSTNNKALHKGQGKKDGKITDNDGKNYEKAYSFAASFGESNTALGRASMICGGAQNTTYSQYGCIVGGASNKNYGTSSAIVGGYYNEIADGSDCLTVIGYYNEPNTSAIFQIGNGSSSKRKNLLEVLKTGQTTLTGNLTVSSYVNAATMTTTGNVSFTNGLIATNGTSGVVYVDKQLNANQVFVTQAPNSSTAVVRKKELDDLDCSSGSSTTGQTSFVTAVTQTNGLVGYNYQAFEEKSGSCDVCTVKVVGANSSVTVTTPLTFTYF